jgi:hypothetical protein
MFKRRWPYITLALLVAIGVAAYFSAPKLIRWYVEKHYSGVRLVGEVKVVWGGVELRKVEVKRPGLTATLDFVEVNAEKVVTVSGGHVELDLDAFGTKDAASATPGGSASISASGLYVIVSKGHSKVFLEDTWVEAKQVCFKQGTVYHEDRHRADIWQGCVLRDKSGASAQRIEIPVRLPFDIPKVDREQKVVIHGVEAILTDKLVGFSSATLGPFTVKGPASVKLDNEMVLFDAPKIVVNHPWVAPYEASFNNVGVLTPLDTVKTGEGPIELHVGKAHVIIHPEDYSIQGSAECNDWLDFLPHPLPEALQQVSGNYKGSLAFEVRARPIPNLDIHNNCSFVCSAEPIKSLRGRTFSYMAYDKDNKLFERKAGPNSPGWVSIGDLPPHVPHAFVLLEDPGFYRHRGILPEALENSLKANLATGEFTRGGSTITMQLAKNLWLQRHKTVGRKAYEALLTIALESCLSKADILEWYMNVVEYGPDLYGIGPATKHYFHEDARQLEADEAFYLAGLLPHPKSALPPNGGGLEKARKLMESLANSGIISEHLVPLKEGVVLDTKDWAVSE